LPWACWFSRLVWDSPWPASAAPTPSGRATSRCSSPASTGAPGGATGAVHHRSCLPRRHHRTNASLCAHLFRVSRSSVANAACSLPGTGFPARRCRPSRRTFRSLPAGRSGACRPLLNSLRLSCCSRRGWAGVPGRVRRFSRSVGDSSVLPVGWEMWDGRSLSGWVVGSGSARDGGGRCPPCLKGWAIS
jgi:hypothetical protein